MSDDKKPDTAKKPDAKDEHHEEKNGLPIWSIVGALLVLFWTDIPTKFVNFIGNFLGTIRMNAQGVIWLLAGFACITVLGIMRTKAKAKADAKAHKV